MSDSSSGHERKREAPLFASRSRGFFAALRLAIGVAILIYLARAGIIDWRALSRLFTQWPITAAAIALLLLDVALMSERLCRLLRPLGLRLTWYNSMQLTLVGFFFSAFLPGAAGGDVARIFYAAKENGGRRTEIITVLILDRAVGLFALLILPFLFVPLFPDLVRTVPAVRILLITSGMLAAGMLGAFAAVVLRPSFIGRVLRGRIVGQILGTLGAYRRNWETIVAAVAISLVAHLCLTAVTTFGVLALNPDSWVMKMCLVIPMGHVANSLPVTPGGLGVGEAAFNALFAAVGLCGGAEALICFRIWKAIVGVLGLAIYMRGLQVKVLKTTHHA